MEDAIAIGLMVAIAAGLILGIRYVVKRIIKYKLSKEQERIEEQKRRVEATRKWRESLYNKVQTKSPKISTPTPKTTSRVSYSPENGDDLIETMIQTTLLNLAANHSSVSATVNRNYNDDTVNISWTTNDDDKKSSSSSTWSSSESYTTDSGPSSDW